MYVIGILKGSIKIKPKLGGENYRIWSKSIKLLLEAKLLWGVVSGVIPCSNASTRLNDHAAWKVDDVQARMWNFVNCESSQQSHLEDAKRCFEAWNTLK